MRTFLTFMTLGAAGAGYFYLQLPAPVGEPYYPIRPARSSFNVALSNLGFNSPPPSSGQDLVERVHERTRSFYNEVSNRNDFGSVQSTDDAFERLRKVVQTTAMTLSVADQETIEPAAEVAKSSSVPEPGLDELKRTAFSSDIDEKPRLSLVSGTDTTEPQSVTGEQRVEPASVAPVSAPVADVKNVPDVSVTEQPVVEAPVSTPQAVSAAQVGSSPTPTGVQSTPPIANGVAVGDPRKRTITTLASNRVTKYLASEWKVVGMSAEGRPMHTMHLGDSGMRTLVIAGLYGDDRTGVHWMELLSEELRRQPELLENNEVMLFRAGNPDGLVRNSPNNSRSIPLNRNFPSRRYRPTPDLPAFAVPASEVETRVILETLYSFRPRRVIHLGATVNKSQVLYNRAATSVAHEFERGVKLTAQMFDSEQFPGSIEDFADGTLDAAVISMRLGIGNDWKQAWGKFQPHVLAAVVAQPSEGGGQAQQQADADRTPIPAARSASAPRVPRRRGYEELPPPPLQ